MSGYCTLSGEKLLVKRFWNEEDVVLEVSNMPDLEVLRATYNKMAGTTPA